MIAYYSLTIIAIAILAYWFTKKIRIINSNLILKIIKISEDQDNFFKDISEKMDKQISNLKFEVSSMVSNYEKMGDVRIDAIIKELEELKTLVEIHLSKSDNNGTHNN